MINVTKTYLPPLKEYVKYLEKIWESGYVTNYGKFAIQLEEELKKFLGVKHLFFVSNGTIALQIAIRALGLKGEIITTPFSYIASASSIVWENCKPIFVDIDPDTLTIDPKKIENAITRRTRAILAVHVYGNPCDIEKIQKIAKKHNLKVIYDAAHTFGATYNNESLAKFGDVSVLSFHATKIFHTIEGGALVTQDDKIAHKISYMRNFGHKGQEDFFGLGINGKNSEFHAAMGLSILKHFPSLIKKYKKISYHYSELFKSTPIKKITLRHEKGHNFAYYPIIFESESKLLKVKKVLNEKKIFPRRYFYPALHTLPFLKKTKCPIAEDISKRVLCLPVHYKLSKNDIKNIVSLILKSL